MILIDIILKGGNASDGTWGRHLGFQKPEVLHIDYLFLIGYILPTILCGTFDIQAFSETLLICADVFLLRYTSNPTFASATHHCSLIYHTVENIVHLECFRHNFGWISNQKTQLYYQYLLRWRCRSKSRSLSIFNKNIHQIHV